MFHAGLLRWREQILANPAAPHCSHA
jgi:hypothetical protein